MADARSHVSGTAGPDSGEWLPFPTSGGSEPGEEPAAKLAAHESGKPHGGIGGPGQAGPGPRPQDWGQRNVRAHRRFDGQGLAEGRAAGFRGQRGECGTRQWGADGCLAGGFDGRWKGGFRMG